MIASILLPSDSESRTTDPSPVVWPPPALPVTTAYAFNKIFDIPCKYVISNRKLGDGTFSSVHECKSTVTGKHYAAKLYNKRTVWGYESMLQNEFDTLKKVSHGHPNVLSLVDYFETPESLYLITDLARGGELFDRIAERSHLEEDEVKAITYTLVSAVVYLHSKNIVHRDIKAENILIQPNRELTLSISSKLLLVDFGFARKVEPPTSKIHELAGTLSYMAPEYFDKYKGHSLPVDVWAIGVLVYFMCCGYMPFDCETDDETKEAIQKGDYSYEPASYWSHISQSTKDFIDSCFVVDPDNRPTAAQLLESPFLKSAMPRSKVSTSATLDGVSRKLNSHIQRIGTQPTSQTQLLQIPSRYPSGMRVSTSTKGSLSHSSSVLSHTKTMTSASSKSISSIVSLSFSEVESALEGARCLSPDSVSRFSTPVSSAPGSRNGSVENFMMFLNQTENNQFEHVENIAPHDDAPTFYL
ncbi:kinase-like protein [Scheffersomyces amazonensis]|uniref:kinase-like protein n=1 Tax=Scheffersomyces amazonensis TaxID=1078765 RepID=UPI00315D70AE